MAELHSQSTPIQTIYDWYRQDKLIVNRRYQRKLVWTLEEKQKLIDSIINRYPVPAILVAEIDGTEEKYEIIDGLQRLHALLSFIETSYPTQVDTYFDLSYFPTANDLAENGTFETDETNKKIPSSLCSTILNYPLSVSIVRKATEEEINDIFDRINTYGHRLSDQERRQAGIQSKFSNCVRKIACAVRGDISEDKLFLYNMPSISIDLPKSKHGYQVRADEVFWMRQGILRSTELRDSEDEQCIADILSCMIGANLIDRSKIALDSIYDQSNDEYERINLALELYGEEKVVEEFKFCLEEIEKICSAGEEAKLREIVFERRTNNSFPSVFAAVFIAIFECGVKREHKISNYKDVRSALTAISTRVKAGQGGAKKADRRKNIDVIKGLIDSYFIKDKNIKATIYSDHKITDIEAELRRSQIELPNYELKQGILNLASKNDPEYTKMLDKLLRTISAIANNGNGSSGKIIIGVADDEKDARKIKHADKIDYKKIGDNFVVGVNREAKKLKKTTEQYVSIIKNHISNSKLSNTTKTSILSNIDYHSYFGLGILIINIPKQKEITYLGEEIFCRQGSEVHKVTSPKDIIALGARFQ